jgi:hypothetical protein
MNSIWIDIGLFLLCIIFTVAYGIRNSFQFLENKYRFTDKDRSLKYNHYWHYAQATVQLTFFVAVGTKAGFWIAFIGAASFWLLFDVIVNTFGLGQSAFYVGQTALLDRMIRKYFTRHDEIELAVIKVFVLAFGIIGYLGIVEKNFHALGNFIKNIFV